MPNTIISDTSCLIILTNINEIDLLRKMYGKIITTPEVAEEFGQNILATITDKKLQVSTNTTSTDYFEADVQTVQDYYAGGMFKPGLQLSINFYRYGHNTQEKSDEISGSGNHYTALFWEYDPRLVRRWNPDPRTDAWESVYTAFANNPIFHSDILGDTEEERKKAVAKANEYKEKSPNNVYGYSKKGDKVPGDKGKPGDAVDCSGMVSGCIVASGLENPVGKGKGRGVEWSRSSKHQQRLTMLILSK